jgi:hypothetical protein
MVFVATLSIFGVRMIAELNNRSFAGKATCPLSIAIRSPSTQKGHIKKLLSPDESRGDFHFTYPKAVTCSLIKRARHLADPSA